MKDTPQTEKKARQIFNGRFSIPYLEDIAKESPVREIQQTNHESDFCRRETDRQRDRQTETERGELGFTHIFGVSTSG